MAVIASVTALILSSACESTATKSSTDIDTSSIQGYIESLAIDSDTVYYISSAEYHSSDPSTLWASTSASAARRVGPVAISGACTSPALVDLRRIAPGRLTAIAQCRETEKVYYVAIDPSSRPLAAQVISELPSYYYSVAWDPRLGRGWIAYGQNDCSALGTLSVSHGAATFGEFGQAKFFGWNLTTGIDDGPGWDCSGTGEAGYPVLAADGALLYFLASSKANGLAVDSVARTDAPWTLYVMDTRTSAVTAVADGFTDVIDIAANGDGTKVVVAGKRSGSAGLWVTDRASDKGPQRVAAGIYTSPRFLGDSELLAVRLQDSGQAVSRVEIGHR